MRTIKKSVLIVFFFLLLPVSASALVPGDKLLPFSARDMDGRQVDLATIIGSKPVMLIFWASWCPNCIQEVPKVNKLHANYGNKGMEFIAINVGYNDSEGKARRFIDKTGMNYPVIFDSKGSLSRQYSVQGVPTILVADRNGIIVYKNYGVPELTAESFKQLSQ